MSARRTAEIIRCHYRKVDKIRKIRRDGWPELQEDVRNDVVTISKAYKLIRDMELGEDEKKSRRKLSAAQIKAAKTLFTEENFAILEELGEDVATHVNNAVEVYIRGLQNKERLEERREEVAKG